MYARMVEILANKDETESHIAPSLEFSELPSLVPTKSYMKAALEKHSARMTMNTYLLSYALASLFALF
jgi:hypothetical protein